MFAFISENDLPLSFIYEIKTRFLILPEMPKINIFSAAFKYIFQPQTQEMNRSSAPVKKIKSIFKLKTFFPFTFFSFDSLVYKHQFIQPAFVRVIEPRKY